VVLAACGALRLLSACTVPTYDGAGKACDELHPCPGGYSCVVYVCADGLVSSGKAAIASSVEKAGLEASKAVDGDPYTRWSSAWSDPQWIEIDLAGSYAISRMVLDWDPAYAKAYQLQVSSDGNTWTDVYSTSNGRGDQEDLSVVGTGRYVRMYGTARATEFGYSLAELEVYGH
jgi:hypothetical protein